MTREEMHTVVGIIRTPDAADDYLADVDDLGETDFSDGAKLLRIRKSGQDYAISVVPPALYDGIMQGNMVHD